MALLSEQLHAMWSSLDPGAQSVNVSEPPGNADLGPVPLGRLPLLRLTEVEVHGTDLGLNLDEWSNVFISTALPMRLEWLNTRRANHKAFDTDPEGSWLLVATDGPTYRVSLNGSKVESLPASAESPARAVLEATSRDLLALLLGRAFHRPPVITGDVAFGRTFPRTFPGP